MSTRAPSEDLVALRRPRFRGVLHQWSFFGALAVGFVLVVTRSSVSHALIAFVYAAGVCTMFGVSALFHRVDWRPSMVERMLQLDKTGIYVMIAGSFTPVAAIGVGGRFGLTMLIGVYAVSLLLIAGLWSPWTPPYGLITGTYIGVGSIALLALPRFWDLSPNFTILILLGGVLYVGGSFMLALRVPDPWPEIFGYHEVWHVLVFAASTIHYVAIWIWVF